MSDTLKDAAAQVILAALHAAEQSGAWLKGQMPDVLHQLLTYYAYSASVWMWVFIAVGFAALLVVIIGIWNDHVDSCSFGGPLAFVGFIVLVICIVAAVINFLDLKEIQMAPKVWILEYAKGLLK